MKNVNATYFRLSIKIWAVVLAAFPLVANLPVLAQHQGHNMPGMSKAKPRSKATTRRKKKVVRKRQPAKKQDMGNMPGMKMPAKPSASPTQAPQPSPQQMQMNMPGMQMPSASPQTQTNIPGIQVPQASPSASPQTHTHMPGMQMPAASPSPQASPQQKMDMNMPMPSASPSASPGGEMPGMNMGGTNKGSLLVMSGNSMGVRLGGSESNVINLGQMGSGTSWQPTTSPMHMMDKIAGKWLLMAHFNLLIGLNSQGGPRGITKFESANWFMPIAFRRVGPGTLQLRGMLSLEPFTFAPGGSPLLFQTGETYKGQPIIDRQHPHDLFMELSAQYTVPLGEKGTWFTYFGYPGEPALGPPAFMHRASAAENPSAPLSHHLQDSTHISFGVLTTGITYRGFKLEGSVFNGHEPDENRYNFDVNRWNSRSARLSYEPNNNWSMQVSYGFLRSPEASEPTTDIRRVTASVQYNKPLKRGNWASAFIWGRNHTSRPGEVHNLNGYTFESTVNFQDKNYLYTRLELVDKNELLRATDRALLGITDDHPSFRIGGYTLGGARDIWNTKKLSMAIGSDLTFYSKPSILDRIYGNNPVSWRLFFRVRPAKMDMSVHAMNGNKSGETKHKH